MNSPQLPRPESPDSGSVLTSGYVGQALEIRPQTRFKACNIDKNILDDFFSGMAYLSVRSLVERACSEAQHVRPGEWCNRKLKAVFEQHGIKYDPGGHNDLKSKKSQAVMNLLLSLQTNSDQKSSDDGKPLHERFCALLQDAHSVFTGGQQLLIAEIGKQSSGSAVPSGASSTSESDGAPHSPTVCCALQTDDAGLVRIDTDEDADWVPGKAFKVAADAFANMFGNSVSKVAPVKPDRLAVGSGAKLTCLASSLNMARAGFYRNKYVSTSVGLDVTAKPGQEIVPVLFAKKLAFHQLPAYIQRRLTKACSRTPDETVSLINAFMIADEAKAFEGASFNIFLDSKIAADYGSLFKQPQNHQYSPVGMTVALPKDLVGNGSFFKSCWSLHEQGVDADVVNLPHGGSGDTTCRQDIEFAQLPPIIRAAGGDDTLSTAQEAGLAIPFGVQICRQPDGVVRRLEQALPEPREGETRRRTLGQLIAKSFGRGVNKEEAIDLDTVPTALASERTWRSSEFQLARTVLTNSAGIISVRTLSGIEVSDVEELRSRLLQRAFCADEEKPNEISIL